jgi:two-component system response regulator PilR (NtrC family)
MPATALIIDDEPDIRELIAMTLSRMGLETHTAANLAEARELLSAYQFDVCLTDMRLPDGNGVDFVRHIQSVQPALPVAVITAHGNQQAAVDAMKNGAYDFVSKPVDINLLRQLVTQAVALGSVDEKNKPDNHKATNGNTQEQEQAAPSQQPASRKKITPVSSERLIGQSAPMQELRLMIAKLARTNAPVWITGESGTGKELIATLIHENSPRGQASFVAVNCGAIPAELMESELFGHKKGSFTGAHADHDGLFQRAQGGTLFLDEVAELPLHMQVKLLRVIQERSVRAVGSSDETPVDVRILSASHRDLAAEVDAGRFRHDLYYRLNVISLRAPSLRERCEDVPELVAYILTRLQGDTADEQAVQLSADAMIQLQRYAFPGNVRELENLLERAVALSDGDSIGCDDLLLHSKNSQPDTMVAHTSTGSPNDSADTERDTIVSVLNETRWNRRAAAEQLGLTYRQLRYRMQQMGISGDNRAA